MKYPRFLSLFLLTVPLSLLAQQAPIDSGQLLKIRVDPQAAIGAEVSTLFSAVEYVPLETNKKSIFGSISQLEVTDDRYVIFDFDTWSVLFFDHQGKFVNRITAKNIGSANNINVSKENEGNIFNGFSIDRTPMGNFVDIRSKNSVLRYDMDGKFLNKSSKNGSSDIVLADGTHIIPGLRVNKEVFNEFAIVKDNKDTVRYFPVPIKKFETDEFIITGSRFDISPDLRSILYYDYYSYDILELSGKGVTYKYKFILPGTNSLPADFLTAPAYKFKKWDYLSKHNNVVYGFKNVFQVGGKLFMTLEVAAQQSAVKKTFAYDLNTRQNYSIQHLTPDDLSYGLPITDSPYGTNFVSGGFLRFDGKCFYTSISALSMMKFRDQAKDNKSVYPPALKAFFSKGSSESNPMLVVLKPR